MVSEMTDAQLAMDGVHQTGLSLPTTTTTTTTTGTHLQHINFVQRNMEKCALYSF